MSSNVTPTSKPVKTTGLHVGDADPGVHKVDPILIADGVKRTFGGLTAVDVDHVEVPRGAITALIGPNGAGKTTLFNLLTGFDKPDEGKWEFDGRRSRTCPPTGSRAWGSSAPSSSRRRSACSPCSTT